jgi:cytochrome c2
VSKDTHENIRWDFKIFDTYIIVPKDIIDGTTFHPMQAKDKCSGTLPRPPSTHAMQGY